MKELANEFISEVDSMDKNEWNRIIGDFSDANIYQTWDYGCIQSGENNLSHLLLKYNGKVIAAAQVRIIKIPFLNIGFAYIYWGPIWRHHVTQPDIKIFEQSIRALRNEFAIRRRLIVRIRPLLYDEDSAIYLPILEQEGFCNIDYEIKQRTLLVDLTRPTDVLRKGFNVKWRGHLNKSERNNLTVQEGFDDNLFKMFIDLHDEMISRKNFVAGSDASQFRMIQNSLPVDYKLKVFIALSDGVPLAGVVCSLVGDMGIYLYGATSNMGLKMQGSYLLQWRIIHWLKDNGAKWYNLHGINPDTNPGVYTFKSGLCGKNGKDVHYMGVFDSFVGIRAHILSKLLNLKYFFKKG